MSHKLLSRIIPGILAVGGVCYHCNAEPGPGFSDLSPERQQSILKKIEPPPLPQREVPYSTPMYYLLAKGFTDGANGELVLDRNRPDWQEAILKDWAELGLGASLFLTTPTQWNSPDNVQAILDYCRLSKKHGLKVAVRLGGDDSFPAIEASGWNVHPNNPENRIDEYVQWTTRVAETLKGQVDHYMVGDEVNGNSWEESDGKGGTIQGLKAPEDKRWTAEVYMQVFTKISEAVKKADPDARVSMFGMGGLDWDYVQQLLDIGYAKHGDGVGANFGENPPAEVREFSRNVHDIAPHFKLYSNGVGYIAAQTDVSFPSNARGYKRLSDEDQAKAIARSTITMWDNGWDSAPYYIVLRQWQLANGTVAPHWYGFFGFQDYVIDEEGNLSVKHYPAWNAYQTVAHTFYNRSSTKTPDKKVETSEPVDETLCYVRNDYEYLVVLWNHGDKTSTTSLTLPTAEFRYPVMVSLYDYKKLTDLPYTIEGDRLTISNVKITNEPTIIRLVAEK